MWYSFVVILHDLGKDGFLMSRIIKAVLLAVGLAVCAYSGMQNGTGMIWVLYLLIFIAGFIDAIAGGGGLISLSAYYAVGLPPHIALGTNKFSSSMGTIVAAGRFIVSGNVQWRSAVLAIVGAMAGSAAGARLALMLDEKYLQYVMLVLVPAVALFVIFKKDFGAPSKQMSPTAMQVCSLITGLIIGCYDGFFGPGTGTFLTIIFTSVIGFDMVTACGNTKVVNLASNLAALATFVLHGNINYQIAVPCAVCGIMGCYLGAGLAIQKGTKIVRPIMLVVVLLLLVKIGGDLFV